MTYQFNTQFQIGLDGEKEIIAYLDNNWLCNVSTREEQRIGIDYWITNKKDNKVFSIEIKTDIKANKTGNAFIETVSVDRDNKAGWFYTSKANLLFYFCKSPDILYIIDFARLRNQEEKWSIYPKKKARNVSYNGEGILVPLTELEKITSKKICF